MPAFFVLAFQSVTKGMTLTDRVEQTIAPSLTAMGYELVRLQLSGGQRPVLQVMCERADRATMGVDDCATVSRALSALLDVEDVVPGAYTLEVSSPGIDRPLTRLGDFARFAGHEAKVELKEPLDGRRRFRGRIDGVDGEAIRLKTTDVAEQETVLLPFAQIMRARLVLTDALIAATGGRG